VLERMKQQFPGIVEGVRGMGLMQGLVLTVAGADAVTIGRANGLLFNCTADKVLRFLPPLNITEADINEAAEKLEKTLKAFAARQ